MSQRQFIFALLATVAIITGCGGGQPGTASASQEPDPPQEPAPPNPPDPPNPPNPPDQPIGNVNIEIYDDAAYHVHPAGQTFTVSVKVEHAGAAAIYCQWQDFRKRPLGDPVLLIPGELKTIQSPDTTVGYYGLVFKTDNDTAVLPNRQPGESREYGFAILAPRTTSERRIEAASPFGMVHADMQDPYLPVWIKTATWKTFSPAEWLSAMERRRGLGMLELPLVLGDTWDSNDSNPISSAQLTELETKMRQYFAADPSVLYWELGLEENLEPRFDRPYYWDNLEAKARAVRQAANAVNPGIKLIYQIAELGTGPVQKFLQSKAAGYFDILSLHPYAWPDFPSPEEWMAGYLQNIRTLMQQNNVQMPIWYTEVGAPHQGNYPGGFFGYPDSGEEVQGLSREEAANYIIKTHVLALHLGVEKMFWYNYMDQGMARDYAEDHFGIRDYWGFPKPVYTAYFTLHSHLNGKNPVSAKQLPDNIRVYRFEGTTENTLVAWVYPGDERLVPLDALQAGLLPADILETVSAVGTPLSLDGNAIRIAGAPVFITTKK